MAGFFKPARGSDYYSVMGEHIVKRVPEGTDGAVPHTITKGENTGKVVYEVHHEGYEGQLQAVYIDKSKDTKFPDKVCLRFDGAVTIQMPVDSQHAKSFICKVRNIDLDKELKFVPYKMERSDVKGKFNIGVTLYQDDTKIENHLNPKKGGDLPNLQERIKAGKKEWDSTDQVNFLFEHLVTWIAEQNFPDPKTLKAEPVADESDAAPEEEEEGDDSIPY